MYKPVPFWVIPATSYIFFCSSIIVLFVIKFSVPPSQSLRIVALAPEERKESSVPINISFITEHNLFHSRSGSVIDVEPEIEAPAIALPELPVMPTLEMVRPVVPTEPRFLDPLAVTLRGIMYSTDEYYSRVILEDVVSKQEKMYKVSDAVADAELIRILPDRVLFIRSNGQIETVFVSAQDAERAIRPEQCDQAVRRIADNAYEVDSCLFDTITSLAQLLEELDATMASSQGVLYGLRIGMIKPNSIGAVLGLRPHDVVVSVNGTSMTSSLDRQKAYESVRATGKAVVAIEREGSELTLSYRLIGKQADYHAQQQLLDNTVLELGANRNTESDMVTRMKQKDRQHRQRSAALYNEDIAVDKD